MSDRLLTDYQIGQAHKPFDLSIEEHRAVAKAQDKKTASIVRQEMVEEIAKDKQLLEIGRKAVEDVLVEWRDGRLSEPFRGNGLVIREKNGGDSSIIRFGAETALRIGLKAIGQELKRKWG